MTKVNEETQSNIRMGESGVGSGCGISSSSLKTEYDRPNFAGKTDDSMRAAGFSKAQGSKWRSLHKGAIWLVVLVMT